MRVYDVGRRYASATDVRHVCMIDERVNPRAPPLRGSIEKSSVASDFDRGFLGMMKVWKE